MMSWTDFRKVQVLRKHLLEVEKLTSAEIKELLISLSRELRPEDLNQVYDHYYKLVELKTK